MRIESATLLLTLALLVGCKASHKRQPDLSNLPSNVVAYLNTSEGKRIIEAVKQQKAAIARTKQVLLNETDHVALLRECRQVIAHRRDLEQHNYSDTQSVIFGNNTNLPPLIKQLKPHSIDATDNKLEIELGSGFHHYGIIAFSDERSYESSSGINTKKLLDGLWFYEDAD